MKQRIESMSCKTLKEKSPQKSKKTGEKDLKKEGLREMQDIMKWNDICIIGIPEVEEETKGRKSVRKSNDGKFP